MVLTVLCRIVAFCFASIAFAVLFVATGWADGPTYRPPRIAAPVQTAESGYNWTGLYLGGGVGHTWSDIDERRFEPDYPQVVELLYSGDNDFFFGRLKAGYDIQLGNTGLVGGVFGTWSPNALIGTSAIDDIYSIGGRIGYGGPKMLVYGFGEYVRMEAQGVDLDGWAAGLGFERPLFSTQALNLTWGAEAKYQEVEGANAILGIDDRSIQALVQINVRFGGLGN